MAIGSPPWGVEAGVTIDQANAKWQALSRGNPGGDRVPQYDAEGKSTTSVQVGDFRRRRILDLRRSYETSLVDAIGHRRAFLLIACANIGNLLLARAQRAEREITVRLSLARPRASGPPICSWKSLLLGSAGAVLGAVLAQWISRSWWRSSARARPTSSLTSGRIGECSPLPW